jgi:hypothetical protein
MFNYWRFPIRLTFIFAVFIMLTLMSACGPVQEDASNQEGSAPVQNSTATPLSPAAVEEPVAEESNGVVDETSPGDEPYPGANAALQPPPTAPYPGPTIEGLQAEPPNPERNLPAADSETGIVGGILIREIVGEGFVPFSPQKLILGEIITLDTGEPAYVGASGESPTAELLPTGIFIFRNISPGDYNLVVDIGITQFLVGDTFTVEAGQVIDLGQVIIEFPD